MEKRGILVLVIALVLFPSLVSAGLSDSGYLYKKNITIPSNILSENLNDFPMLINVYDSDLKSSSNDLGSDIVFASDDNTILKYQIEYFNRSYNSSHALLVAWVKVNLSSTIDNVIWMYFNNSNATSLESPSEVFSSDYKGVYHLKESSGNAIDSSSFSHNSSIVGGTPDYLQDGKIGKAVNLDSSADENFNFGDVNDFDFTEDFSVSAWVKTTQSSPSVGICGKLTHSPNIGYTLQISNGNGQIWINGLYNVSTVNVSDNNWHYLFLTRSGSISTLYIDSNAISTIFNFGSLSNSNSFYIGAWGYHLGNIYDYSGLIDEVQLSNQSKSVAWINASYLNQNSPNQFYSVGDIQIINSSNVIFSNFVENPNSYSIYNLSSSHRFNVTISGSNGTSYLEFNGINYSSTNKSDVFSSVINNLPAGNYNYQWLTYSDSGSHDLVTSNYNLYVINKTDSIIDLKLNNSASDIIISVGSMIDLNCSLLTGESSIELYKNGVLINSGKPKIGNRTNFTTIGVYNITCIYPSSQNYSSISSSFIVNAGNVTNEPVNLNYNIPTPNSGSITSNTSIDIFYEILTNNLTQSIFNWDNYALKYYDSSLLFWMNFDNNQNLLENSTNFFDISLRRNNGNCSGTSCPNYTSYGGRFARTNLNNNNLIFMDRFDNNLSDWVVNQYGGSVSIVTKDFSKKLLLNDTSSVSYVSSLINFSINNSRYIIEYDTMFNSGSIGIMELLDEFDNVIGTIDCGSSTNTISFSTDSSSISTGVYNSGSYKQIVLGINPIIGEIRAYMSEPDDTQGSLVQIGSAKNYSGSLIKKLRFRTSTLGTGSVYFDEVRIYKPVMALIGDSITDGKPRWSTHPAYPYRLSGSANETSMPNYKISERLCTDCWVANRAFGGTTTTGIDGHIKTAVLDQGFSQVYISIGHNDIMNGANLPTMQAYFNSIIDKILASGISGQNIIIANVFPSGYLTASDKTSLRNQWNSWLRQKASDLGAIYVDLDSQLKDPNNNISIKSGLSDDGTHLYPWGNDLLADSVVSAIYDSDNSHGYGKISFDGINDNIFVRNDTYLINNNLTVSLYSKILSTNTNTNSKIISKGSSFYIGLNNNKYIAKIRSSGINATVITSSSYNDNLWHNVILNYNGSVLQLYIDGILVGSNSTVSGAIDSTSERFIIGSNGSSEYFSGSVDEIRVYDKSMNPQDISFINNSEFRKINSTSWKFYINENNLLQRNYQYSTTSSNVFGFSNTPEIRNITIIYDLIPPFQIRNLVNITSELLTISWVWINPSDSDFFTNLIYLNNINVVNTSNNYYTANSLNAGSNYNITIYTKDSSDNINTTGVSAITQTKSNPVTNPTNNDGSGGGGSSGGGSIVYFPKSNYTIANESIKGLDISKLGGIISQSGEKRTLSINVKNIGNVFLNKCKLLFKGEISPWFYSNQAKGIAPGENVNYVFDLNVPEGVNSKDYTGNLEIKCDEANNSEDIIVTISPNFQLFSINDVKQDRNELVINYSYNSLNSSLESVEVAIWLENRDGVEVKKIIDDFNLDSKDKILRSVRMPVDSSMKGVYYVYIALPKNLKNQVKQSIVLGSSATTGQVIMDLEKSRIAGYIVFFLIVGFILLMIFREKVFSLFRKQSKPEKVIKKKVKKKDPKNCKDGEECLLN